MRFELLKAAVRARDGILAAGLWCQAGHVKRLLPPQNSGLRCFRSANDLRLLHSNLVRGDFGLTNEGGAFFDNEPSSLQITDKLSAAFEFAALFHGDVSLHFAVHGNRLGLDLAADFSVFTNGEDSRGEDLAFDFTVDDQIILELDGTFDLYISGKDVLGVRINIGHIGFEFLCWRIFAVCFRSSLSRLVSVLLRQNAIKHGATIKALKYDVKRFG